MTIPESDYHVYPAWSYSVISRYAKEGFSALATLGQSIEPTPSMRFGSLVDCMVTRGMEEARNSYVVLENNIPNAERKVLDTLLTLTDATDFASVPQEALVEAIKVCNYQSRWSYDTQYSHIAAYAHYYDVIASGKEIVSIEDWQDAYDMTEALHNDTYCGTLFKQTSTGDIEYLYQMQYLVPVHTADEDTKLKIMADLIIVDHKNKTIQPVDLKTSSEPAYKFKDNFVKYRYDLQAQCYTYAIGQVAFEEYSDYTILPYLFVDISRTDKVPVAYKYDVQEQSDGLTFGSDKVYHFKTWLDYLSEILEYQRSNAVVPKEITLDGPNDIVELLSSRS